MLRIKKNSEENVSSKVIQLHSSYLVTILVQLVELAQLAQLAELGGHHRHRLLLAKLFLSALFYLAGVFCLLQRYKQFNFCIS